MAKISPLAVVDPAAILHESVEVGPFCVIGPHVVLKAGVRLLSHVCIEGHTDIGENTLIYPFAVLGGPPQSVHYRGELTRLEIGANNIIREHVTMNTGTVAGGGLTEVGSHCMFMVGAHIAHDCRVGHHVIMANQATLAGHVQVGDHVFLGGLCAVHQHARIGEQSIIGGMTGVERDVIPFASVLGDRGMLGGLNLIGLKRRGYSREQIHAVRHAYRMLFAAGGSLEERAADVARHFPDDPVIGKIVAFVTEDSKRQFVTPRGQG